MDKEEGVTLYSFGGIEGDERAIRTSLSVNTTFVCVLF